MNQDTKTKFDNINPVTGDTIITSFTNITQDAWNIIFGEQPKRERYMKVRYDENGNEIEIPIGG